jgi:protein-S-isoprenylcysteine O-methyltransferase Ste14
VVFAGQRSGDTHEGAMIFKLVGGIVYTVIIFGVCLFAPAGTLRWWRAWVFLAVLIVCNAWTMFGVMAHNEELLNERYGSPIQKGQPLADRIILIVIVLSFVGFMVLIPLDVFRFHLLGRPGFVASSLGLPLFVAGWVFITLALRENTFAAPVVRHQEERHQAVVDSGVYAIVRHPMYAGAIPMMLGIALWLESYAAALFVAVFMAVVAARIVVEERLLERELPGYTAYTSRVRYRMIPFVW